VLSGGAHHGDAIHIGRRLLLLCWLLVVRDHTGVHTVGGRACECAWAGAVAYGVVSTGRRGLALACPHHAYRRKPARSVAQGASSFFLWIPPVTARAIGAREAGRGALGPTTGGCLVLRLPHFGGAWRRALGATVVGPGVLSERRKRTRGFLGSGLCGQWLNFPSTRAACCRTGRINGGRSIGSARTTTSATCA